MATSSVRLNQELVEKAAIMGKALNRTRPKQIEHWAKIGEIMEDNPDLPYEFVKQAVISRAQKEAGKKLHKNQKADLDKAIRALVKTPLVGRRAKER